MWITFSLFFQYSCILASVQCENCSHNDKSFLAIPNKLGPIGPKWFRLWQPNNLGSGQATISDTWILFFTIYSFRKNYCKKLLILVFFAFFSISVALVQNTMGSQPPQPWPPSAEMAPLAPHRRPCTPHQHIKWMGNNPPSLRMYLGGGVEGVYGPQSAPLFWWWCITTTLKFVEGHTHPQRPQQLYELAWGVVDHP